MEHNQCSSTTALCHKWGVMGNGEGTIEGYDKESHPVSIWIYMLHYHTGSHDPITQFLYMYSSLLSRHSSTAIQCKTVCEHFLFIYSYLLPYIIIKHMTHMHAEGVVNHSKKMKINSIATLKSQTYTYK